MKKTSIANAVIRRMPRYYRHLEALEIKGIKRISSGTLGIQTGLTASQIRQDLACFGEFGQQGFGYGVENLKYELTEILGMNNHYTAVMAGIGRLGMALLANFPFEKYGIRITALYDVDPSVVGTRIKGIPVYHANQLAVHLAEEPVDIGVLTAPADVAQQISNIFAENGVKGIWNYSNVELKPRKGSPIIEDVHFFDSLFFMCCKMAQQDKMETLSYEAI